MNRRKLWTKILEMASGMDYLSFLQKEIFAVFMKNSDVDGGSGDESAVKFEQAVYSSLENKKL